MKRGGQTTSKLEMKRLRKKLNSMMKLKEYLKSAQQVVKLAKEREQVKKELLREEFGIREGSICNSTTSEECAPNAGHKSGKRHSHD